MEAVVIYESIFGNTGAIAQAIADGLAHVRGREDQVRGVDAVVAIDVAGERRQRAVTDPAAATEEGMRQPGNPVPGRDTLRRRRRGLGWRRGHSPAVEQHAHHVARHGRWVVAPAAAAIIWFIASEMAESSSSDSSPPPSLGPQRPVRSPKSPFS